MTISILYSNVLSDLRGKNREEVRSIDDPKARYFAEAGSEKSYEIARCIQEAMSQAKSLFVRFAKVETQQDTSTSNEVSEEDMAIVLNISDRRGNGKADVLTNTFHSLIVNHALSKYYNTVQLPDLAAKRAALATEDVKLLNKLLYEKLPPVYPTIL